MRSVRFFTEHQKQELNQALGQVNFDFSLIKFANVDGGLPSEITSTYQNLKMFGVLDVTSMYGNNVLYTSPSYLYVIFSSPKDMIPEKIITNKVKSHNLVKAKNLFPYFQQPYLYYNNVGQQLSPFANNQDLYNLIANQQTNNYTLAQVRELIGQILLAVNEYHRNNLAHRDLTLENFLVAIIFEKPWLRLSDLESVIEVDAEGKAITPDFFECHPEKYRDPIFKSLIKECRPTQAVMDKINWRAVDCYSISIIIFHFMYHLLNIEERNKIFSHGVTPRPFSPDTAEYFYLYQLMLDLQKDHSVRITVTEAMNSLFFGATKEIRDEFFIQLINDVPKLKLDGVEITTTHFEMNNVNVLLSSNVKQIYTTANTLTQQMYSLDSNLKIKQPEYATSLAELNLEFANIKNTFDSLQPQICPYLPLITLNHALANLINKLQRNLSFISASVRKENLSGNRLSQRNVFTEQQKHSKKRKVAAITASETNDEASLTQKPRQK